MHRRRVSDPPAWTPFVIPAAITVPVIAGILIGGPMVGFVIAALSALAIVAAAWGDGARRRGREAGQWRRAAAGRFLVALTVAGAGIVVATVASGALRTIAWGVVAVAVVLILSLVFLEVGYSEDRARAAERSKPGQRRRVAAARAARRRQPRRRAGVPGPR
jgi:TRAP-type C4-dicarboxylate transport system permease large subunit